MKVHRLLIQGTGNGGNQNYAGLPPFRYADLIRSHGAKMKEQPVVALVSTGRSTLKTRAQAPNIYLDQRASAEFPQSGTAFLQ